MGTDKLLFEGGQWGATGSDMPYFLLLGNPIQSHLDHPCTSYLASRPIDTNSRPKVALASGSKI
jgi:hypothetical protein